MLPIAPSLPFAPQLHRLGRILSLLLLLTLATSAQGDEPAHRDEPQPAARTAADKPAEGPLEPFLGHARCETQQLFESQRFPNVVVTTDGTVVAVWGQKNVRVRRSGDGGATFEPEIVVAASGIHSGGATVDEQRGDLLVFVEDRHPPAPLTLYRSRDQGRSWAAEKVTIAPDRHGNVPSMHMNEHGITLRRGPQAGRLLRAARYYAAGNRRGQWSQHYTTAIYSDDGGATWKTSDPFPEMGTGEATLAERADGSVYYNSRLHWPQARRPTSRRHAVSRDSGATWDDWAIVDVLPDGPQTTAYGCMGGLVRLPVEDRDILLFSNVDTRGARRERTTVWVSCDGGATWPLKRLVDEGPGGYSSLAAGRPETASEGSIYLLYEAGGGRARLARSNLSWLLAGEATGDGQLPAWLARSSE